MADKVTVLLAGPGHDAVFYQMQPTFLSDARFTVAAHATQWNMFEQNLLQMHPDLVVVQAEIAPDPRDLIQGLSKMQAWNGVAIVIVPTALRDMVGIYQAAEGVVRGAYVAPVNWVEIAQNGYSAVMTERARLITAAPMQHNLSSPAGVYSNSYQPSVTGTKRIAIVSHAGGAGCSTIAENLSYQLATKLDVKTLLLSLGLPAVAATHLKFTVEPSLAEYMDRPGRSTLTAITRSTEGLELLFAPSTSSAYLKMDALSNQDARNPASIYSMLLDCEDGKRAAIVMDLPAFECAWMLQPLVFANTVLVVARPTLADCSAVRHTLNLLSRGLKEENRKPRESIYLVLNQASERNTTTPRGFQEELAQVLGWAPPIAAIIPFDPAVQQAQEQRVPVINRADGFSKGIESLINTLFPRLSGTSYKSSSSNRSILRLPRIRLG